MRTPATLPVLLALALALAAPPAAAEPSSRLSLSGPTGPVTVAPDTPTSLLLTVTLELQDVACLDDATFVVDLAATPPAGAQATLAPANATFVVPSGPHFAEPYVGNATVELTLWGAPGNGTHATVAATFAPPADACAAPGGIPPANATWTIAVRGANATAPPTPATPTPSTPGSATPPTSTTPASSTPTPATNANVTAGPRSDGTRIGDYDPPQESSGVPGPGLLGALAAAAAAALVLRRRAGRHPRK